MKRIIACLTALIVLCCCLCGCARTDTNELNDNSMPVVTTVPNLLPQPDTGTVTDGDGIIDDVEDDMQNHRDEKNAEKEKVTSSPGVSASPKVSASPAVTENP